MKLILLFFIVSHKTFAQQSVDSLRQANARCKIAKEDILGNWYVNDSLNSKITFLSDGINIQINGLTHGVGNYFFYVDGDSLFVNGTAPNWPPYDCTLNLLNKNSLEIIFYQFFWKEPKHSLYKRR